MAETREVLIAASHATIGLENYKTSIRTGRHALLADETRHLGGADTGPAPFGLLLSALGACTAMTLRMYAERKAYKLETVEVDAKFLKDNGPGRIERNLRFGGALSPEQVARLLEIAERTPVTLVIKGGVPIATKLL